MYEVGLTGIGNIPDKKITCITFFFGRLALSFVFLALKLPNILSSPKGFIPERIRPQESFLPLNKWKQQQYQFNLPDLSLLQE